MAVSKIMKDTITQDISATTTSNAGVSPFGAYCEKSFDRPSGYTLQSAIPYGIGSTNPVVIRLAWENNTQSSLFVYSRAALTINIRVTFVKE